MATQPADNHTAIDWPLELQNHASWMHGVARSRLGDVHAADDIMQDVSLAVIQQNGRPTDRAKIRAWLYRIVVRRVADHLRQKYKQDEAIAELAHESSADSVDDGRDWVCDVNASQLLQRALERIPEVDRRIFQWKYGEGWSYQRLASECGISERAVEYRLVCARQRLRKEMQSLRKNEEST